MAPVSRETVIEAVKEYGLAWTTQDSRRIGRLFTKDAVYVERSFDKKATFRGRSAIEKYWKYQICGKQSNVAFRHVDSEMVRDADEPIAVVKWLAEFDNKREKRADKTNKRVRFCQMAKLIFEECPRAKQDESISGVANVNASHMKISYLEEYAQGVVGKSFQWPGIDATADELWEKIRFDPPKPPPPIPCDRCGAFFPSRTKVFAHLRYTDAQYTSDGSCICVPNEKAKEMMGMEHVLVCLSVSYWCKNPSEQLLRAWKDVVSELNLDEARENIDEPQVVLTWAVPTEFSLCAIVNVVTMKLPRLPFEEIGVDLLPTALNKMLESNKNAGIITENSCLPSTENGATDAVNLTREMIINTAGIVDRPCAPERRESETYSVFIPWEVLDSKRKCKSINASESDTPDKTRGMAKKEECGAPRLVYIPRKNDPETNASKPKVWRIPIEETRASEFVDSSITQRLKHGTRLMKDCGHGVSSSSDIKGENSSVTLNQKLKVRTCAMDEPMHHYCKISISIRQTEPGYLERLAGLLVAFARFEVSEDNFISALMDKSKDVIVKRNEELWQYKITDFPSNLIVLVEPALTRYENKAKMKLCRFGKTNTSISDSMRASIDMAEGMIMNSITAQENLLFRWVEGSKE